MDIGAFYGKDSKNNELILKTLALNGSLIKWEVLKKAKETTEKITWATVSRRIDNLKKREYLTESSKRRITIAKREVDTPVYGLTWRGLLASLTIKEVRSNMLTVIANNPQIEPLQILYLFVKGKFTEKDIQKVIEEFLKNLADVPIELEYVNEIEFAFYVVPALIATASSFPTKRLNDIEQRPELLEFFCKIVTQAEKQTRQNLEDLERLRAWLEQKLEK